MEAGHKKLERIEKLKGQKWAHVASATNLGKIFKEIQESPEIRNGAGLILGLNTAAGGGREDGKNEGTHWPKVRNPFIV